MNQDNLLTNTLDEIGYTSSWALVVPGVGSICWLGVRRVFGAGSVQGVRSVGKQSCNVIIARVYSLWGTMSDLRERERGFLASADLEPGVSDCSTQQSLCSDVAGLSGGQWRSTTQPHVHMSTSRLHQTGAVVTSGGKKAREREGKKEKKESHSAKMTCSSRTRRKIMGRETEKDRQKKRKTEKERQKERARQKKRDRKR